MIQLQDISKIGIGGWGIGGLATFDPNISDTKQIDSITYAINQGLNYAEINFWNAEGHSVDIIQKALVKSIKKREEMFLSLVIYNYTNPTLDDVKKEIEKFFKIFQTDYIDTLEFPLSAINQYGFKYIVDLVSKHISSGKVRYTSLTNANLEYLQKFHNIFKDKLYSHEVHYSFEIRDNEYLGILAYASKNNIKNVIYQPLRRNRTAQRNWPLIEFLANKYGKTQNQIILNWLVSKGYLPLIKSETITHIDENIASLDFSMDVKDLEQLDNFKVPNYQMQHIDWFVENSGTSIFSLPNSFDELYPSDK